MRKTERDGGDLSLSDQDVLLLSMYADGYSPSEIMLAMSVDRNGLRRYKQRIQTRLIAVNTVHMVAQAMRAGIIK